MSELKELLLSTKKSKDFSAAYEKLTNTKFFVLVEQNEPDEHDNFDFVVFGNEDFPDPMVIIAEELSLLKEDYDAVQMYGGELVEQLHEDLGVMIALGEVDGGFVLPKDDLQWIRETMSEVPVEEQPETELSPFQTAVEAAKEAEDYDLIWPEFLNTSFFVLISSEPGDDELDKHEFVLFQNPNNSEASLLMSEELELLNDHDCDAVQVTGAQLLGMLTEPQGVAIVMPTQILEVSREDIKQVLESMDLEEAEG